MQVLEGRFRYIHVVRDGRDVATGDNQMQHRSLCKFVESEDSVHDTVCGTGGTNTDPTARLEFWVSQYYLF